MVRWRTYLITLFENNILKIKILNLKELVKEKR
jgi:hypothetical protein